MAYSSSASCWFRRWVQTTLCSGGRSRDLWVCEGTLGFYLSVFSHNLILSAALSNCPSRYQLIKCVPLEYRFCFFFYRSFISGIHYVHFSTAKKHFYFSCSHPERLCLTLPLNIWPKVSWNSTVENWILCCPRFPLMLRENFLLWNDFWGIPKFDLMIP